MVYRKHVHKRAFWWNLQLFSRKKQWRVHPFCGYLKAATGRRLEEFLQKLIRPQGSFRPLFQARLSSVFLLAAMFRGTTSFQSLPLSVYAPRASRLQPFCVLATRSHWGFCEAGGRKLLPSRIAQTWRMQDLGFAARKCEARITSGEDFAPPASPSHPHNPRTKLEAE